MTRILYQEKMETKIYKTSLLSKTILLSLLVFMISSCTDVLDKSDLNVLTDHIWDDANQARLYINNLYNDNMPSNYFGTSSQLSDESYSADLQYADLMYGFKTPSDINSVTVMHKDKYELIRRINIALEGLERSSLSEEEKAPLLGQAIFFRAWRYWEMVRLYGGVPMVLTVQDPYSDDLNVRRSKTSESIQRIVADLDEAISLLPLEWSFGSDAGRITSGAAAAFKGRVLLTWASPLFNRNNSQDRWQQAYDANAQAIDLLSRMTVPRALRADFATIFTSNVLNNEEAVLYKRFSLSAGSEYTQGWEGSIRPPSGGGNGGFNPTWQLVKAFPMANGKLPDEAGSGYNEDAYWENRDPRFYATIVYNGDEWQMNGREGDYVWTFRNVKESNRVPSSGFYNKKAFDGSIARENIGQTNTAWIELRYAEVLLNFAECANELGKTAEALEKVRAIRARAGIEPGNGSYGIEDGVSKEVLRQLIMIERQVEFAFENKRYWDIRRRLMFREDLGEYVKKINGTQRTGFTLTALSGWNAEITDASSPYVGQLRIDTAYANSHLVLEDPTSRAKFFRTTVKTLDLFQGVNAVLNYQEFYDFFAIPSSMIEKSPAVEQTAGWLNGTFDPLAE